MLYDPKWETPTKPLEKWRSVLLDAANLVRQRGLAKYAQQESDGRVCLHGAISIAATGKPNCSSSHPVACRASLAVGRYLNSIGVSKALAGKEGSAPWNNQPERTAEEVIAVLEAAALR